MKNIYSIYLIENISLLILAGFLSWYFKSFWGLVPLIFYNTGFRKTNKEGDHANKRAD